jgi:CobQ-like glutamine amidotransferase family enzyme
MKIELLYGEVANFYGDPQNAVYLSQCDPDCEIINTRLDSVPYFAAERPDIILIGSMSEAMQRLAIKSLKPHKERIIELIDDGVVFLATGNAYEIFTEKIEYVTEKITVDGLGLFPLTVKTDLFARYNGMVIGEADGMTLTGFRSQFSFVYGDNSDFAFIKVERGVGINKQSKLEGVRRKNFIGTHLIGPILPLNPEFCEYVLRLAGSNASAAHKQAAMAAYDRRVAEFRDPKVKFD